jgi:chaperonin GroEL
MDKNKEICFGNEARMKIKAGIEKAANAVAPTLGAVGMSATIEFPGLDPIDCDDGVTILKNLKFKDPYEEIGLQKLRKAGVRTSTEAGDGTATTTILTRALVNEAFKEIANDSSKIREVKERLEAGLKETLEALSKIKREVTEEDIEKIATISSLDTEVAKVIADIIKEVGINGVITVEKGSKLGYSSEVVKGARFEKGWVSPYFINNPETNSVVLENPYIVLIDRVISTNEHILTLLNSIGTGKDILFVAEDIRSVALGTLAQNAVNKIANIACVQNPYSASKGKDFLHDIAALTGGTVISEETGMRLDKVDASVCGRAEKVVVTKEHTTIIGGISGKALEARITAIETQIDETTSEYQKLMLKERLASLTGGIGVVRVGTYTDTEFNAKKYKFDNAINSTQAALQEGILAGGGSALASIKVFEPMFAKTIVAPFNQMVKNAGLKKKFWQDDFINCTNYNNIGFDFKTKKPVNMFDAGIIDPFKVTRMALESATAIAISLVTTEVVIVNESEDEKTSQ